MTIIRKRNEGIITTSDFYITIRKYVTFRHEGYHNMMGLLDSIYNLYMLVFSHIIGFIHSSIGQ